MFRICPILVLFACSTPATPSPERAAAHPTSTSTSKIEHPANVEEPTPPKQEVAKAKPYVIADEWNKLLTHVTEDGGFRYAALMEDEAQKESLARLVAEIAKQDVSGESKNAQLAHYINAYNILTVSSVIQHWPIKSVMKVEGFFDKLKHSVSGKMMTLNELENEVIRSETFAEPRIHFAVNCASVGCPWLHSRAFEESTLDETLETLTSAFVKRTTQLQKRKRKVVVSKLFEWFKDDFTQGDNNVRAFVAKYLDAEDAEFVAAKRTKLSYFEYDWALNAR